MTGYFGYSKSNNAVQAEDNGYFPASIIGKKLRVPAGFIKEYFKPCEWHHCSKWYNEVDYYNLESIRESLTTTESQEALEEYRKRDKARQLPVKYYDCKVTYLRWFGRKSLPETIELLGRTVTVKSKTATISLGNGQTLAKRLTTRGFSFIPDYTKYKKKQEQAAKVNAKEQAKINREFKKAVRVIAEALIDRFKQTAKMRRFEKCNHWALERAGRDMNAVSWEPITYKEIIDLLKSSVIEDYLEQTAYAERTVKRLEMGNLPSVRLGLNINLRYKSDKFKTY